MAKKRKQETYDNTPCDCGEHFGRGLWNAQKKAEIYAWYRDKYRLKFTWEMKCYLATYQRKHGPVKPNI